MTQHEKAVKGDIEPVSNRKTMKLLDRRRCSGLNIPQVINVIKTFQPPKLVYTMMSRIFIEIESLSKRYVLHLIGSTEDSVL